MGIFKFLFKSFFPAEGRLTASDVNQIRGSWGKVEEQLSFGKLSNLQQAVILADKTVDYALRAFYPNTVTMGDRLKLAKQKFQGDLKAYDDLWYAHKIRNEIAHNIDFYLPSFEAKSVVEKFRNALKYLGAI
ncbi:MAG: hypothetical protein M1150_01440 [Patescibacteria group bacterium]|nr:hypothetical protein [Patescibacteria group bacterium]